MQTFRKSHLSLLLLAPLGSACGGEGTGQPEYTDDVSDLASDGGSGGDGDGDGDDASTGGGPSVPPPLDLCPEDACPYEGGVTWRCETRFLYGANWAWNRFGSDFGGHKDWDVPGVSTAPTTFSTKMAEMKANGVNVIRWWMFPDFRSDGISFDEHGTPTGLGGTFFDDLSRAIELAQIHDVYLMLTLFSFDAFKPTDNGRPYLTEIVLNETKRAALIEHVVRPVAAHVEAHEHAIRVHSWDLINEPEWAMIGPSIHGDQSYLANDLGTDPISHAEMDGFLSEVNEALHQESSALTSVGTTLKWPQSWKNIDLDFHQMHYYPWLEPSFPLDVTPEELGLGDKPVVLGEFPLSDTYSAGSIYTYEETLELLIANGWAGAMGWDWDTATLANKRQVGAFAEANACITAY